MSFVDVVPFVPCCSFRSSLGVTLLTKLLARFCLCGQVVPRLPLQLQPLLPSLPQLLAATTIVLLLGWVLLTAAAHSDSCCRRCLDGRAKQLRPAPRQPWTKQQQRQRPQQSRWSFLSSSSSSSSGGGTVDECRPLLLPRPAGGDFVSDKPPTAFETF
eukprot:COSAG06_NODE_4726_length_3999_cov_315.784872_2_plen_158_part_00